MSDSIKLVVGGILLFVVLVGFSFWFNNGGQWDVDRCTFTKEPVACRMLVEMRTKPHA